MGNTCAGEAKQIVEQADERKEHKVPEDKAPEDKASEAEAQVAEIPEDKAPEEKPPPPPKLTIKIMGARGLRNADWLPGMGTSDCMCKVKTVGKVESESYVFQTKTINNTLTPLWQEEAEITDFNDGDSLEFSVWDEDTGKSPDFLGKVVLKNEDFANDGFNGELQLTEAGNGKAFLRLKVKMAGQDDYRAGPASEFTINFDKDPKVKALGLDLNETEGKYIYVTDVTAGPFKKYNEKAEKDKQLRPGDFLVKINDKEGNAKQMADELRNKTVTSFEIVARHPEEICIAINKKEAKTALGLDFPKKLIGNALLITKVNNGPFQEWNDANKDQKVCDNDRVVSVAGFQGKAAELQKRMLKATTFQAIIVRPADANSWYY